MIHSKIGRPKDKITINKVDPEVNYFNLVNVVVDNNELTARPVEFLFDKNGNVNQVVKYETSCPNCGNMIQFKLQEALIVKNDAYYVGCSNCGKGFDLDEQSINKSEIKIVQSGQVISQDYKQRDVCPFVDPIKEGMFSISIGLADVPKPELVEKSSLEIAKLIDDDTKDVLPVDPAPVALVASADPAQVVPVDPAPLDKKEPVDLGDSDYASAPAAPAAPVKTTQNTKEKRGKKINLSNFAGKIGIEPTK